ncbi:hypothetical protein [Tunicatimonas pelagia]|uniref:hypothetical protein n=1 Tax=Tunicatimonas pelagia TaxID=931531 RepID=UPI002665FF04|nr:hypothetical protein [Tunicatimonas pelagia]WKN45288.1 hypothetical protein P0M28_09990 [Tunicatimonas pelagia]
MPSEGKLQISSTTSSVSVYSNTCNDLHFEDNDDGSAVVTTLASGDEVFIEWETNGVGSFDWDILITPLEAGDNRSLATTATTGANALPTTTSPTYWYAYTLPSEGKLEVSSETSYYVRIYRGTCDGLSEVANGYDSTSSTIFNNGETVFIQWNTAKSGDFNWNVKVVPLSSGDNCALASTAVIGMNTTPAAPYWYEYTVPASANYTISSVGTTTVDTYLYVYSDCNETLIDYNDDFSDFQSELTLSLTEGNTIYILWDDVYSSDDFEWALSSDAPMKTAQQITFNSLPDRSLADNTNTFELTATATASSGLAVAYTSSDETIATISSNIVTIVGVGTTTITAIQPGDDTYQSATDVSQYLTVTAAHQQAEVNCSGLTANIVERVDITCNGASNGSLTVSIEGGSLRTSTV